MSVASSQRRRESKQRLRLWLRLLKASRMMESRVRENMREEFNSTLPRFDVMSALFRFRGGLKMSELSQELKVSNGNVTGIVDRLEQDGLIRRTAVPGDRRAWTVQLTDKGITEFQKQAKVHEHWVNELMSGFDGEQARTLAGQLEALAVSLQHSEATKVQP